MGRKAARLRWVGVALLLAAGCWTPEKSLKPPVHPEEYAIPPEDDARFSKPPTFPSETLNAKKKPTHTGPPSLSSPSRHGYGAGSGLNRY